MYVDAMIAHDGQSARVYGTSEELERVIEGLPATKRARVTLRRTDLSDVAFHLGERAA